MTAFLCLTAQMQAETLAYWSFENIATPQNGSTIGSFATTSAAYGEAYNTTTKRMANNTSGTLGSNAYLDFSQSPAVANGTYIAGSKAGWGSFTNGGHNALLLSTFGSTTSGDNATAQMFDLVLNTKGYGSVTISFDYRLSDLNSTNSILFNGTATLDTFTATAAGGTNWFSYSKTFTSLSDLDTFSLTFKIASTAGASLSIDNLMITASAIPEPSTWALIGIGLVTIGILRFRKSRA